MTDNRRAVILVLILGLIAIPAHQRARAGFSAIPLNDLGSGSYLGFEGGLYPEGSNTMPAEHAAAGKLGADLIEPLDENGFPDPAGKYVMLSVGMSNTNQEFCGNSLDGVSCHAWTFMGQAAASELVEKEGLVIVNGAMGGQVSAAWEYPDSPNYTRIRDQLLAPLGLSEQQVQIVWVKVANPQPSISLPEPEADAIALLRQMGNIARTLKIRYPNLQQVFLSSRIYAGYATTTLNPEAYAYESGFAVKWLVEAQINQMNTGVVNLLAGNLNYDTAAPWLAWGPYLWADGPDPRSDGLTWEPSDFQDDGTHPSQNGEFKVGTLLMDFFLNTPQTVCWFRVGQSCPAGFEIYIPVARIEPVGD